VARPHLLYYERGGLPLDTERKIQEHRDACAGCTRPVSAEWALTELLERHLPQHSASLARKRRLATRWPDTIPRQRFCVPRWAWSVGPALAVVGLVGVGFPFVSGKLAGLRQSDATEAMVSEAVNDHLRVLDRPRPLDVDPGDRD
jgi:hypothetical protein